MTPSTVLAMAFVVMVTLLRLAAGLDLRGTLESIRWRGLHYEIAWMAALFVSTLLLVVGLASQDILLALGSGAVVLLALPPVVATAGATLAAVPLWAWGLLLGAYPLSEWCMGNPGAAWGFAELMVGWMLTGRALTALACHLGSARLAHGCGIAFDDTWRRQRDVGGVLAAARALTRHPGRDLRTVTWLEGRCSETAPLLSLLLTRGMLAAARGDRESAHKWLLGILDLPSEMAKPAQRAVAAEWLCAWAATEGRWHDLQQFATAVPRRRVLPFWRLAARRVLEGDAAVSSLRLRLAWIGCPWSSLPLLELVLSLPPASPPSLSPPDAGRDALQEALHQHLSTLRRSPRRVTPACLRALTGAWDAADAPAPMLQDVEDDLVSLVVAGEVDLVEAGTDSRLLGRVRGRVERQLLMDVQRMAEAMRERLRDHGLLPKSDEWMEWMTLRLAYERARATVGPLLAGLMWPGVHTALNLLAVKLLGPMDHPIFRWLADEAHRQGDREAVSLERRNAQVTSPAAKLLPQPAGNGQPSPGIPYYAIGVIASVLARTAGGCQPTPPATTFPDRPMRPVVITASPLATPPPWARPAPKRSWEAPTRSGGAASPLRPTAPPRPAAGAPVVPAPPRKAAGLPPRGP